MKSSKNISENTQSPISSSPLTDSEKLSNSMSKKDDRKIPWTNFFYKIWWNIFRIFRNPFKEKVREPRLLEQVDILISGDVDKTVDICEKYISFHRIVENTKARRRLEKWITRLIVWYLIIVGIIVLGNSFSVWMFSEGYPYIHISESIMIVLLSTTTVNIVALGIILVRGLFHEHEKEDIKKENVKKVKTD